MPKLKLMVSILGLVGGVASIASGALQSKLEDQKIEEAVAKALANQSKEA